MLIEKDTAKRKNNMKPLNQKHQKKKQKEQQLQTEDSYKEQLQQQLESEVEKHQAELSRQITARRPGIKVLFMSGETEDMVLRDRVKQGSAPFLQKPFTPDGLLAKLRVVLDED